jgi:hypothetical protein
MSHTPFPRPAEPPAPPRRSRRPLLVGVVLGVVLPLCSFLATAFAGADSVGIGTVLWAGTAFVGVLLLVFERTRSYGLGILLGFCALVVIGAGVCTTVVLGLGIGG